MQRGGEIFNNLVFLNISLPMAILVVTKIFMCRLLIIVIQTISSDVKIFGSTNLRPCLPKALTARQQYKCFILQNYVVMMSWMECYNAIVRSQLLVACSECRNGILIWRNPAPFQYSFLWLWAWNSHLDHMWFTNG